MITGSSVGGPTRDRDSQTLGHGTQRIPFGHLRRCVRQELLRGARIARDGIDGRPERVAQVIGPQAGQPEFGAGALERLPRRRCTLKTSIGPRRQSWLRWPPRAVPRSKRSQPIRSRVQGAQVVLDDFGRDRASQNLAGVLIVAPMNATVDSCVIYIVADLLQLRVETW